MNNWYFRLKSSDFHLKASLFKELLWQAIKHYVNNFYTSKTFKDVSNTLQNFEFIRAMVFEIAKGPPDPPPGKSCGYQMAWKRKGQQNS